MSEKTNIEWATSTGNPWIGCTKVSPGCKNCYAATMDEQRFSKTMGGATKAKPIPHWGKGAPRVRTKGFWTDAVKWNKQAIECEKFLEGQDRPRIFPSLCDWLDEEVPIEWLADFLKLIHDTPNLDWLLLTKRPENWLRRLRQVFEVFSQFKPWVYEMVFQWIEQITIPSNVWLGVSVEDQKRADERIPALLAIPAKVRFLSVEPLLEPVHLPFWDTFEHGEACNNDDCALAGGPEDCDGVVVPREKPNWVIVGGESGKARRDCGVEAICDVARQCVAAGVRCFVKQDFALKPGQQGRIPDEIWKLKQFPI